MKAKSPAPTSQRTGWAGAIALLALFLAGFGLLYAEVIRKLAAQWAADDNYSHGFLVVPLALYFAWERRARLTAIPRQPALAGLAVVVAGLVVLAAGAAGAELFLTRVSMLFVLGGTVVFLWGWVQLRILAFPIGFLLLAIPPPAVVFNQVAFPLQLVASSTGEAALEMAGVAVLREGNILHLASTTLEVAEACSGIRSLVSLFTLAVVLAYFTETRRTMRVGLALAAVPVAILANGARVAGTGLMSHHWGVSAAEGFFHTFSGGLVFFVALGALIALQCALRALSTYGRRLRGGLVIGAGAGEGERCSPGRLS